MSCTVYCGVDRGEFQSREGKCVGAKAIAKLASKILPTAGVEQSLQAHNPAEQARNVGMKLL